MAINLHKKDLPSLSLNVAHHVPDAAPLRSNAEIMAATVATARARRLAALVTESNADVMAAAVAVVRAKRLGDAS